MYLKPLKQTSYITITQEKDDTISKIIADSTDLLIASNQLINKLETCKTDHLSEKLTISRMIEEIEDLTTELHLFKIHLTGLA